MLLEKIQKALTQRGQEQLLIGIEQLSEQQLQAFLSQIEKHGLILSLRQKSLLLEEDVTDFSQNIPFPHSERSGNEEDHQLGQALLRQGKVGCLILAGGQGTRLGADGPKGSVPVSPIRGKSLFQLFCERAKAASLWFGQDLPLCIMTSPLNHAQTVAFFCSHNHFGLSPSQICFFEQGMLPFVDDHGQWLLEELGKIAEGPDGNGNALRLFFENGLWKEWKDKGIEILNIIVVDNALADPFDSELIGFAHRTDADVALKTVERLSSDEKMGVIAERDKKLKLIEYSEIPVGSTQFALSNTGLFCVSMEFIQHLYQDFPVELPLHLARKFAPVLQETSHGFIQDKAHIWKCERFLFDIFDYARRAKVVVYPREKTYAPLKNADGDKSVETVKKMLCSHYRDVYQALTGLHPPVDEFELDPAFYYPSEELRQALVRFPLSDKSYVPNLIPNFS